MTEAHGWAYPSDDGYQRETATGPLGDGDLLAPVLLNVRFLSITTYEALRTQVPELQAVLAEIPTDLDLLDAGNDELSLLGHLFSVLDGDGISGAQGTVLAKVLHRKRPQFIPLYDGRVRNVYQDGEGAPVPGARGRSWQAFIPLFAAAVRDDLRSELDFYSELAGLALNPPITPASRPRHRRLVGRRHPLAGPVAVPGSAAGLVCEAKAHPCPCHAALVTSGTVRTRGPPRLRRSTGP